MVLDLHTGQANAQEGGRHHGADEGGAVAADHHGDGSMSGIHTEGIAHADEHGQQAVEVGVGAEQQGEGHGQHADDDGQEAAHGSGDERGQHIGHVVHDAALLQHAQEHAGGQNGGGHHQTGGRVGLDDLILHLGAGVVDKQSDDAADHKGAVGGDLDKHQGQNDHQGQDQVDPEELGTGQLVFLLLADAGIVAVAVVNNQSAVDTGAPALFNVAPDKSGHKSDDDTNRLHGHQLDPQVIGLNAQHGGGAHGGAAPGQQVHNAHGGHADEQQSGGAHLQALVHGKHGGDGDQEGGGSAAVQVADHGDDAGHHGHAYHIGAYLLHQGIDDPVKQAHIIHDAEKQHREDEQGSRGVDVSDACGNKVTHLFDGKGSGKYQNRGSHGGYAYKGQSRYGDIPQQQDDDGDDGSKAQQRQHGFIHCNFLLIFLSSPAWFW